MWARGCSGYNRCVLPTPLSADTSAEIEARQVERWRQMSGAEKAAIVSGLTQAVYELARAGIRHRFPHAPEDEVHLRLAVVTLGPALARQVYPALAALD